MESPENVDHGSALMTRRVPMRSILRHLFVHGLVHTDDLRYSHPGPIGCFQNFKEGRRGCQRPRVRKNRFSLPTRLSGKKPHDVWGAHKRNNYSCQAVVGNEPRRSHMRLPLPSLSWGRMRPIMLTSRHVYLMERQCWNRRKSRCAGDNTSEKLC